MHKSIGFQTRSYADSSIKIGGGCFGGSLDIETINRLVHNHKFTVVIKPSGSAVFVDKEGREVWLSVTVKPADTIIGAEALRKYRADKAKEAEKNEAQAEQEREEIDALLDGLTHAEIIQRLKGKNHE